MRKRHRLVLRGLLAQKAQFTALAVVIALGAAMFVSMVTAFANLGGSYQRTYDELHFADYTVGVRSAPQEAAESVRRLDHVAAAEGRLVLDTGLVRDDGQPIHVRLVGLPLDRRPAVNDLLVQQGSYWSPQDRDVALVGSNFAKFHELEPGARLTFVTPQGERELTITGVAASPEYLIAAASKLDILPSARRFGVFFVPLQHLQQLFGLDGLINEVAVTVIDDEGREAAIAATQAVLAPYALAQTVRQEDQPSNAALQLDLRGAEEFANVLPTLILVVAALSIFIALSRMVQAQREQVGLFMATGYSRGVVLRHYLAYAVLIAFIGSIVGVALGLWLGGGLTSVYAETLGIPLVEQEFQPLPPAIAFIVSMLISLVAGMVPAWRSARMQPAAAMRLDPQIALAKGGVPWVERALRLVAPPPLAIRIPLRSIFRTRLRSLYTVAGMSFALVLLLTSAGVFDSMTYMLDLQYEQAERWDIDVSLRATDDPAVWQRVSGWTEVRSVEPTLEGFGQLRRDGKSVDVLLMALPANTQLHQFQLSSSKRNVLGDGKAVLSLYASQQTGAEAGDQVTLETPTGTATLTVSGVTREALGSSGVFLDLAEAQRLAGTEGLHNGLLIATEPSEAENLAGLLYEMPGVESVTLKAHTVEDWEELLGLFYALAGVLLVAALVMAAAIVFNTVTVNVLERQRELATMRTLGQTRGRLAQMMVLENVLVGVGALLPGFLLGTAVAYYVTNSFSSDLLTMLISIAPRSYAAVGIGVLLVVALSVLPAVRRVNRMNLAEVTKVLT
ncbi:MAG: hypothetical protein CL878_00870 [Dehalococcoidia bacterium]|nr:hypothetical protein [Dehalococcoidia bacterium]